MNINSAIAQANLNRINQYTPQGSLTYRQTGTNADGTPQYEQSMQYSAGEQAKYDQANEVALALGNLAGANIGRVQDAQSQTFNYDGMTPLRTGINQGNPFGISSGPTSAYGTQSGIQDPGSIQRSIGANDLSADGRRVADAVYGQATSRLDPQWQQSESDMRARLASQGISENSDAYRRELDNMGRSRNDAYNAANYAAIQAGGDEQSRLFGIEQAQGQFTNQAQDQQYQQYLALADLFNQSEAQRFGQDQSATAFNNQANSQYFNQDASAASFNNDARTRQIEEAAYLRNLPLNDIAALLGTGGGVQAPEFSQFGQVGVAAPDYQGIVSNNYSAAMNMYNQQQANRSAGLGSIFGALGSIGGAFAMSDARLKKGIKYVAQLANGLKLYTFKYIGDTKTRFGAMAQQVALKYDNAVIKMPNGYYAVNYAKVYA